MQSRQVVADMEVSAFCLFSTPASEAQHAVPADGGQYGGALTPGVEDLSEHKAHGLKGLSLTFLAGPRCKHTAEPARPARDDTALAAEAA